jgi:SSS family solute:Na+ symporter
MSTAGSEQATAVLATVDIVIIIGFLVLVTIVGLVMSKAAAGGLDDYFLGGNKIPWWVLGASTATSNFDMSGTMIIVAVVFALGFKGFLVEIRGGVGLSLAFLMVFLGKWLRRSRVMTSAEWMKLRFGTDRPGKWAHLLSALANITLSLGMIIYFAKGAGKFLTHFLPFSEFGCTAMMVTVGLAYTLMSGLYGVVFTDVVQMIILTFTAIFVSVQAFALRSEITLPKGMLQLDLDVPVGVGESLLAKDPGSWEPILNMFGICVVMWLFRTTLEGMGGVGGYTDQRFFAARNEREAGLLTLEALVLSLFRWTMVAGLVVMGYHLVQTNGPGADLITGDAEQVLPVVLGQFLPAGVRGVVIAGLIAAAMSTFDSTLNAGASYIVKDIYQSYLRPKAGPKDLMWMSRWATIGLCVVGVAAAAVVPNINQIWGLVTMGIGAGLFVPLFLRWYWPRFNGYGFAAGTGAGIVAALIFKALLDLPLYQSFPTIIGCALVASVVGTYLSAPVSESVLVDFWVRINPWGTWGRIADRARKLGKMSKEERLQRTIENLYDWVALCFAVPFQLCLLLGGMSFIFHDWKKVAFFALGAVFSGIGLYFFWYRNLKSEEQCKKEDEYYASLKKEAAAAAADEAAEAAPAE